MVECKYRGRVIGWLVEGIGGRLKYVKHVSECPLGVMTQWPDGRWNFRGPTGWKVGNQS